MPFRPILLTGATGFVGAVVLDRLLRAGHEVVCLVRAGSDADADARLRAVLARAGAPAGARARAVAGDLTAPGLGLGARRAARAAALGTVGHGAAAGAVDLS
ncbi:MAG: SDR family oxidoreductase, partial [Solirubrobacteraceae bacterium]